MLFGSKSYHNFQKETASYQLKDFGMGEGLLGVVGNMFVPLVSLCSTCQREKV